MEESKEIIISDKKIKQGRNLTRVILISSAIIMFTTATLQEIISREPFSFRLYIGLSIVLIIYIFLYLGYNLARWLVVIALGASGLYAIIVTISTLIDSWFVLIPIVIGLIYFVYAILLATVPSIRHFKIFKNKRNY